MKKKCPILSAVIMISLMVSSCGGGASNEVTSEGGASNEITSEGGVSNEVTSENDEFNEVNIGYNVWMTENLNVDKFRNGDPIPEARTEEEWQKAIENSQPVWCYYDNDPTNGAKYGKLYNWYAVNDPRKLAPKGWHIPDDSEWSFLINYLDGKTDDLAPATVSLEEAGTKMKHTSGWNENGNGTNSSGLSCLPGGFRGHNGAFRSIGLIGCWWSSTEKDITYAWVRDLSCYDGTVSREGYIKGRGLSVRCLKDGDRPAM